MTFKFSFESLLFTTSFINRTKFALVLFIYDILHQNKNKKTSWLTTVKCASDTIVKEQPVRREDMYGSIEMKSSINFISTLLQLKQDF